MAQLDHVNSLPRSPVMEDVSSAFTSSYFVVAFQALLFLSSSRW
jgi:hypothetical protein